MMKGAGTFDKHILAAIHRIRGLHIINALHPLAPDVDGFLAAGKWKIIALTNNFSALNKASPDPAHPSHIPKSELEYLGWEYGGPVPPQVRALFDDFCDSSTFGMRKPEHAFYIAACQHSRIEPKEAVFLDDIGV